MSILSCRGVIKIRNRSLFLCMFRTRVSRSAARAKLVIAWFNRKIGLGAGKMVKY